jgi:hypothetical protein
MFAYVAITILLGVAVYLLRRGRLVNVALLIFSLSLCITALEAYYRFIYARSDGFGRLSKNFAERYYHLDEFGLRASNLPLSTTKPNVVVVGDSHVFGAGLKSPTDRFSDRLAAQFPGTHVVTLGWSGSNTTDQIEQIEKYLPTTGYEIPLVILAYFFNDIESDVTTADRERLISGPPPPQPTALDHLLQRVSQHSRTVEMLYYRAGYPRLVRDRLNEILLFYKDPEIMSRHMATLERLRSAVEQRDSARLLVVLLPFLHSEKLLQDSAFYERFNRRLLQHGFEFVDTQPVLAQHEPSALQVHRFDPHTNPLANKLVADVIIAYLKAHPEIPLRR